MLEAVSALKAAIAVLEKHHGKSLMELSHSDARFGIATVLRRVSQHHAGRLQASLRRSAQEAAESLTQEPDYFGKSATFKNHYASTSGEIFGILRDMLDTFEANLSTAQKEELAKMKAFEEMKAAKEAEIAAGQEMFDQKTAALAETDAKKAQDEQALEDTENILAADEQFLKDLKEKCAMTDKEWEERQKTRALEVEAVSKALAVLSTDDAHDLYTKTFNPSLLQTTSQARLTSRRN